ncbi:MAG: aminotransferase class V-fold PLP-dependent enzyme, partial [Longimicrobiales bacterium]|nr:aminotransferase class V-fold PLP-dependent enzyme [Longimicrobiales bacterium]
TGSPVPLFVSSVEHSAVLEAAEHVEASRDASVTVLETSPDGSLDLEPLEKGAPTSSRDGAAPLVSVMWVNNETGMVLPVDDVVEAGRSWGAATHSDASQALGKVPISVVEPGLDLLTATGHKIGGPRGMGILFVREGVELMPLLFGGGQERRLRPGTEDVAGAVGLATAIRLAVSEQEEEAARLESLRSRLESGLRARIAGIRINCGEARRSPHVSSVGITGIPDGQALLMALDLEGVAVSGGSACHSGAGKGSHVIAALYGSDDPMATVRFSLGRTSTADDVDRAVAATAAVVDRIRPSSEDAA